MPDIGGCLLTLVAFLFPVVLCGTAIIAFVLYAGLLRWDWERAGLGAGVIALYGFHLLLVAYLPYALGFGGIRLLAPLIRVTYVPYASAVLTAASFFALAVLLLTASDEVVGSVAVIAVPISLGALMSSLAYSPARSLKLLRRTQSERAALLRPSRLRVPGVSAQ